MSSLLHRLASHLDAGPDEAGHALEAFGERIGQRVAQDGETRVPGLGRFYQHRGHLAFEPDETFALAANRRFAGLESTTVAAPQQAAPEAAPEDAYAGAGFSNDGGTSEGEPEPDVPDERLPEEERLWEETGLGIHPLGEASEPPFEDADYSVMDGGATAATTASAAPADPEPPKVADPERASPPALKPRHSRTSKPSAAQLASRSRQPWIAAAAAILLLAIAGLLFLLPEGDDVASEDPLIVQTEPPQPQPTADSLGAAPGAAAAANTADAATPEPQTPVPAPEPEEDPSPLRSSGTIDTDAGGYTLVVISETQIERAVAARERYRELGYRAGIVEGEVEGRTYYRVGVGQFPDYDEAVEVLNNLPADLPEGAWLTRITSSN